MFDRDKLIADLENRDEGFRDFPYDDATGQPVQAQGKVTFAIGWNLQARRLTHEQARIICGWHVDEIGGQLTSLIKWFGALDEVRSRALGNMAFQLGTHGLIEFSGMLSAMRDARWDAAADAALDSKWARQVPARAKRIADMIRTGMDAEVVS